MSAISLFSGCVKHKISMHKLKVSTILVSATLFLSHHNIAFSWSVFGPKNYDECILENMKDVKTDQAANAVAYACASKFLSDNQSQKQKPKKLRCNGMDIDPNEYAEVQFPVPNDFGSLKIVKMAWEPMNNYSSENVFRIYIQHSYPYSIQGLYLQGYTSKNAEDASYWCSGTIASNRLLKYSVPESETIAL